MFRRRIAGKRTVEEDAHVHAKNERTECTDRNLACPLPEASQSASIDTELRLRQRGKDQLMTVKLTRARDRVSMSYRLFLGRPLREKNEILKWTTRCSKRNSAPVEEMSNFFVSTGLHCWITKMRSCGASCWTVSRVSSRKGTRRVTITTQRQPNNR